VSVTHVRAPADDVAEILVSESAIAARSAAGGRPLLSQAATITPKESVIEERRKALRRNVRVMAVVFWSSVSCREFVSATIVRLEAKYSGNSAREF